MKIISYLNYHLGLLGNKFMRRMLSKILSILILTSLLMSIFASYAFASSVDSVTVADNAPSISSLKSKDVIWPSFSGDLHSQNAILIDANSPHA